MRSAWLALGCVLGATFLAACGGTTESAGGGGGSNVVSEGPIDQAQLSQKYADAICSNSGPCCQKYGFSYDASSCATGMRGELEKELGEIAGAQGVTYDAAKAGECVAWVKKVVTQCIVSESDMNTMKVTCAAIWRGTKTTGESCSTDVECAGAETDSADCDISNTPDGGTTGKCVANSTTQAPRGVKGAPCSGTCKSFTGYTECSGGGGTGGSGPTPGPAECWIDDGLQCDSATYTCVELIPEGQPCSYDDVCVTTAWCKSGTCVPKSAVGGECSYGQWGGSCVDGAWCDMSTSRCAQQVAEGAACNGSEQCSTGRCESNKCIPANVVVEDEICSGPSSDEPGN